MNLTETKEGKNATRVLAMAAKSQREENPPRQKDLQEKLGISKGTVSKKCSELVDMYLLEKENRRYKLNAETLLRYYEDHFEEHLMVESPPDGDTFKEEIERENKARSLVSDSEEILTTPSLKNLLVSTLIDSLDTNRVQTLPHVFLRTDMHLQYISFQTADSDRNWEQLDPLAKLGYCIKGTELIGKVLENNTSDDLEGTGREISLRFPDEGDI